MLRAWAVLHILAATAPLPSVSHSSPALDCEPPDGCLDRRRCSDDEPNPPRDFSPFQPELPLPIDLPGTSFQLSERGEGNGQLRGLDRFQETGRSEEHTSELQSHSDLVCRLL